MNDEDRIILIDKPAKITSFGVVARVRSRLSRELGHKVKIGHAGTLDPFATGLLILLSGKYTHNFDEFQGLDKVYTATMRLGFTSTTGDPEGEIKKTSGITPSISEIQAVFQDFTGTITQRPPRYSAVKINGQRAYKLARKGVEFEVPTREVTIYELDIISYNYPELKFMARVSSGTYIRTLAEDIAKALGTDAYLTELRRLQIGDYVVSDAFTLDHF